MDVFFCCVLFMPYILVLVMFWGGFAHAKWLKEVPVHSRKKMWHDFVGCV